VSSLAGTERQYHATWGLTTYATAEDATKAAETHVRSAGDE